MPHVTLTRRQQVPDSIRIQRALRAPELGARLLFFSGGSALRSTSQTLIDYTHNSIHLVTPFDSGGSSAKLRDVIPMISVGDLRNRLMALSDRALRGHPAVYELFGYRLAESMPGTDGTDAADGEATSVLKAELDAMVQGSHPLVRRIPNPLRKLIRVSLADFVEHAPHDFDLRGASIGNLILAGGYLKNECDIDAVIFLFSRLVEVRGLVRPIVGANLHLAADLEDGRVVVGQHRLTRRAAADATAIAKLRLTSSVDVDAKAEAHIDDFTRELITGADLLVFPIGSFFTSVVANLLPGGVGSSIAAAGCPKVYVPNSGEDPELRGLSVEASVQRLLEVLRADAPSQTPTEALLNLVVVDTEGGRYPGGLDVAAIQALGVDVLDTRLVSDPSQSYFDPRCLVETLISLC